MTTSPTRRIEPVSMTGYDRDFDGFSQALTDSFRQTGFAIVSDHGLDQRVIDRAVEATKAFFALPEAVKRSYHVVGGGGARGYTPFRIETAKGAAIADLKEFWHVGRELAPGHRFSDSMPPNLWPAEVAEFREAELALYDALDAMGRKLLRAIAHALALPDDWFDDKVDEGNSVLRLLHYPPLSADAPAGVRAGAHEDINTITLLLGAEEAGLEVKTREGEWLPVNPPPGALVVNVGDMLQRLTNHVLPSTSHRVVNPAAERRGFSRYSTPFFLHFESDFLIETLPQCVTPDNPDRYPEPITADDYLQQRLREIKLA